MICTLGNFATKLLRGDPAGISRVHGRAEVRTIGSHTTRLYPIFHPAAALYTPATLETLREDFSAAAGRAGDAGAAPARRTPVSPSPSPRPSPSRPSEPAAAAPAGEAEQLGLF